jgi:SIR2-like domain
MIGSAYDGALQELVTRLFLRKLVPFLGAGCSVGEPSRMPVASGVAQLLIDRGAGTEGQALEDIAEEAWARGGWQEFAQLLPIDEWRTRPPNVITRVVAELCKETLIAQILTTNWDLLMESALSQIGQPYAKVVDAHTLAIEPAGRVTLIKLNGCIDHPQFIKATRTQIEAPDWLDAWVDATFDLLVRTSSLLFAGYSGASRAATTTVANLVEAGERHAADFIVDRQAPGAIAASSESGSRFVKAVNRASAFTGEARDFFAALRVAAYPLLLAQPAACARAMAGELVAPTSVAAEDLLEEIGQIVEAGPLLGVVVNPERLRKQIRLLARLARPTR